MRDMPEHLPELPEGAVYIGQGGDVPHDFRGGLWCCHERVGDWRYVECDFSLVHHYAAPIDSDLGRKILAERGKPDWSQAPDWAEWLAQDENGEWWWFEREPTVQTDAKGSFWNPTRGEACEASDGGEGTAHRWRTTLERRPEHSQVDRYARAHKAVQDDLAEWTGMPDGWEPPPQLVIPADIQDNLSVTELQPVVEWARMQGYCIEWGDSGLRGWKEP